MGWREFFGFAARPPRAIASPWSPHTLAPVLAEDILGVTGAPSVTREAAMQVPAVARARHILTSTVARLPLRVMDVRGALQQQPTFLTRTDGVVSPQLRLAWTVDDLLFHGYSLWAVERNADGSPRVVDRVPVEAWRFEADGTIVVDDEPVDDRSVLLFVGFHEGILSFGASTIATAKELESTAAKRASVPLPVVELHDTEPVDLEPHEIQAVVGAYVRGRRDPDGAVLYTPSRIDLRAHSANDSGELMIQARNASAVDVARLCGVPASLIDASNVNATLTYETTQGRNLEFVDYALSMYLQPIESRLSMDDVVPRGQRVRFDTSALISAPIPTSATVED